MDGKKKPDDWLAAYEAAKQKALQNLDSGKLQSVTGISGFCGKIKNVDHLSSNYNVTKLINAMKDGKIKKKKTVQNGGGNKVDGVLSKNQREKERKKRRNAKRREENGEEIQANVNDDNSDNEAKPKSTGLTKNQRERERRKRRKKALAAGNAETEETIETDKSTAKKPTKKSKSNILAQKSANQAILDEQKNRIMELQMGKSCEFQFPEKSSDSNADTNKPSKYTFKKFEFKPKSKESKASNKAPSSNVSNGLKMIASSYDSKEVNNDKKVKIEKEASAGKLKSKEQESMSQLNSTARWLTSLDSKEIKNDKRVQVRKEASPRKSKSVEQDSMNQLNSTARWLANLESNQNSEKTPDVSKNKKMSESKTLSTTQTSDNTNDKKRKTEEEKVSSKRIKNDVIHMNSLGLGQWLKELESDPDTENNIDSECDVKSSIPAKNFFQNPTKIENNKPLANSKVNDPSKTDIKDKTSKTPSPESIKNNTDSWLASYQAKKEAALKNMKEGKLQSVVGISAFCGKNDQVSNFSKTNQVTKLMDKFKRDEVNPIKKQVKSPLPKEPVKLNTKQVLGGNFKFGTKNNPSKPLMTTESTPKPLMSLNSSLKPLQGINNPPKPLMTMNIPSKPLISSWNNSIPKPQGSPATQVRNNEGMLGHVPSGFNVGGLNQPGNSCPAPLIKNNMQGGAQTGPSAFDKKPPPPPDKAISEVIGDGKPFSSSSGVIGDAKPFSSIGSIRLSDNFLGNAGKTSKNNYFQNYQSPNFGMGVGQAIDGGMRDNRNESGCGLKGWARVDNNMKGWSSTTMRNVEGCLDAGVNLMGMTGLGGNLMGMGGAMAGRGGNLMGMGGAMEGRGGNSMGMGGAMAGRGGNSMGMGGAMAGRGGNSMGMGGAMTGGGGNSMLMGGAMAGRGGNSMGMGGAMAGRVGNSMGMGGAMAGRSSIGREGNGNYMDSSFKGGMAAIKTRPTNADRIPPGGATSYTRGEMEAGGFGSYMRSGMGDSMEGSVGQGMRTGSIPPSSGEFGFGGQYGQYSEQEYNSGDYNRSSSSGTLKNNSNNWMYSGENSGGYGQDFSTPSDNRTNRSKPTVTFGKAKSTQLFQWIKPS